MDKKNRPVLTIISIVLSVLHLIALIFCIAAIFTQSFKAYLAVIALSLAVISIIVSVMSNKENRKKAFGFIAAINIVFLLADLGASLFGILQESMINNRESREQSAQQRARDYSDVEFIKTILPKNKLSLRNARNIGTDLFCYDLDGVVTNKFIAIDFTLQEYEELPDLAPASFYSTVDCTVTFFADYSGLKVESHVDASGLTYGHIFYSYTNTYSIDVTKGEELRNLIDNIIDEQLLDYQELEEEVKNSIVLSSTINNMDEEGVKLQCEYHKPRDDTFDSYREIDEEKVVLNALKEIDFNEVTRYEGEVTSYFYSGFEYKSLKNVGMVILTYNHQNNTLKVGKYYMDMFDRERKTEVTFLIKEEDGNKLMTFVENFIKGIRGLDSI